MRRNDYDVTATLRFPPDWFEALAQRAAEINAAPVDDGYVNSKNAAAFLDITEKALEHRTRRGEIPVHRASNGRLSYRKDELRAYAEGRL